MSQISFIEVLMIQGVKLHVTVKHVPLISSCKTCYAFEQTHLIFSEMVEKLVNYIEYLIFYYLFTK